MILTRKLRALRTVHEKEIRRAVLHIFCAPLFVLLALALGETIAPLFFSGVVVLGFIAALISKKHPIPIIAHGIQWFDRKDELLPGKGAFFYLLSGTLCLFIFPQKIAFAAVLFLGIADGTASLIGRNGKLQYTYSRKTIEGSIAGACAGIAVTAFFLLPVLVAVIAGILTMVVESFDLPPYFDDNIVTPLVFALIAQYIGFAFVQ